MRVALYYPWVYLKGGAERTILETVRRSRHEWTIVTNHYEPYSTFPEFRELDVIELATVSVKRSMYEVAHAALTLLVQRFDWSQYDALLVSSEGVGNLVNFSRNLPPTFCYCHTPLKIAYDPITRERFFAQRRAWILKLGINAFTLIDRLAWRRYQHVFCNSEETRQRVLRANLFPEQKLEVLHPGIDLEVYKPTGIVEDYFLLPGRIMWTKNIELAIAAFKQFKQAYPHYGHWRLVIAGMLDQKSKPYCGELMRQAGKDRSIDFVITPNEHDMLELYRKAGAVLSTSLNEDWGLTVVEGMAMGKPVLAVNQGGPAESIEHGASGFLCEPTPEAFAEKMAFLAANRAAAAAMGVAARQRSLRYGWQNFTARIDDYVETLVISQMPVSRGASRDAGNAAIPGGILGGGTPDASRDAGVPGIAGVPRAALQAQPAPQMKSAQMKSEG